MPLKMLKSLLKNQEHKQAALQAALPDIQTPNGPYAMPREAIRDYKRLEKKQRREMRRKGMIEVEPNVWLTQEQAAELVRQTGRQID